MRRLIGPGFRAARGAALIGGAVCAALVVGVVSPVAAAEQGASAGAVQLGGFAVGDGLEGLVGEQDGSLQLSLPVGGVTVGWDSRQAGEGRYGLGGWGWNLGHVQVDGGVRVTLASGESFEAGSSSPSGLLGYHADDVKFVAGEGRVEARPDVLGDEGVRSLAPGDRERAYAFVMHELGGSATYYSAAGDPVVRRSLTGSRVDLIWDETVPHRLLGVVNPDGVLTRVDWAPDGVVSIVSGANVRSPEPGAPVAGSVWRLMPGPGGLSSVVDPLGGVVRIDANDAGLLTRVRGASGAVTEVSWRAGLDGAAHVDTVRTTEGVGGPVVSERTWRAADGRIASGWPAIGDAGFGNAAVADGYETVLSDGPTSIVSTYDEHHLLTGREVRSASPSGEQVVQTQRMNYPERPAAVPADGSLPADWNRPSSIELVYSDDSGRSRTESTSFSFDGYGREVERRDADGLVTRTTYDPPPAGSALPPVGLPTVVRTEAADGLVAETRHELNDEGTRIERTETWSNAGSAAEPSSDPDPEPGDELVLTGRTDIAVDADGFVAERRVYPQGGVGDPVVTTFERSEDPAAGTVTVSETVAAGTADAVTTSAVTDLVSGQALRRTDAVGNTVSVAYDELGRVVAQTDALGRTAHTEYRTAETDGVNSVSVTTPDLVTRTQERDALGRVTRVMDNIRNGAPADGHQRVSELRSYPDAATVVVTDAWGAKTTTREDVFGRVIETVAPTGATQVTAFDDLDRTSESGITLTGDLADAEAVVRQRSDARGAAVESTGRRADGIEVPTMQTSRDGFGRPVSSSDGTTSTEVELDAFGNPVTTTTTATATGAMTGPGADDATPEPLVATREFDAFGTSVEKVLSSGEQSGSGGRQQLDVLGRTIAETDQRGSTSTIEYTPDGLVHRQVSGFGAVAEFRYDPKTRAVLEAVASSPTGATVRTAFDHDPVTGATTGVFDPADREATLIATEYDAWGNTTKVGYPDGKVLEHEYDANGRRIATVDVAGNRTDFAYDRAGLLTSAVQTDEHERPLASARYEYDELGRMVALERGNGVRSEYEFTSVGEIAAETTTDADGRTLAERHYTYDARGQLTTRTDTVSDGGAEPATTTTSYEYDELGRLAASSIEPGTVEPGAEAEPADQPAPSTRTEYALTVSGDIAGERRSTADGGTMTREFEYSPTGELLAVTTDGVRREQQYDEAGNLVVGADGTEYAYDAMDRPVEERTSAGETITTRYWADGSRREHASGPAVTAFYWDGGTLINDAHTLDGSSWRTAAYLIGAERHARSLTAEPGSADGDVQYLMTDRHGSVTALTDRDGRTSARYTYSDYGVVAISGSPEASVRQAQDGAAHRPDSVLVGDATRQPFQYSGAYADPTGDLHLAIRAYDADTARWREKDPERLFSRYAYANLNPIMLVDPTGRYAQPDAATGVLGGLSLVLAAFSIAAAVVTGGASLAGFGAFGLTADIAGVALSATLLADSASAKPFLPKNVREGFEIAEVALIPIGLAGAIADGYRAYKATRPAMAADDYIELDELPDRALSSDFIPAFTEWEHVPVKHYWPPLTSPVELHHPLPVRHPSGGPVVLDSPVEIFPPHSWLMQHEVYPKFHGVPIPRDLVHRIDQSVDQIRSLSESGRRAAYIAKNPYDSVDLDNLMYSDPLRMAVMLKIGGHDASFLGHFGQDWLDATLTEFVAGAKHIAMHADEGLPEAISAEQRFNSVWSAGWLQRLSGKMPTLRQVAAYQ